MSQALVVVAIIFAAGFAIHPPANVAPDRTNQNVVRELMKGRAAVERSLRCQIRPLIARCERDLRRTSRPRDREGHIATARERIAAVLQEAQRRREVQECALDELDAALACLERGRELTQVKDVTRSRALVHVALTEIGPTTQSVPKASNSR